MEDTVDILLATYNTKEEYLRQQLESLLNQTYTNIKILVSDDASPDKRVREVVKEYEEKDRRIILFEHDNNLGFNGNFEFLLNQSTSKFVMFCDHDDVWHSNKVEMSLSTLKEKKCSMVYCNSVQIDENGVIIKNDYFKYKNVPIVNGKSKLAMTRCVGLGCSQIITSEVKEKMIPFKSEVMAHDWLAAFIANEQNGIVCVKDKLFDYRLHSNNVFGGRNLKQNLNRWKDKNGKDYSSYKKYRQEVIEKAYLSGAKMCLVYSENQANKKMLEKVIKYYEGIKKANIINVHFISYFKYLGGRNMFKKMVKECMLFHFPIISYLLYKVN